MWRPGAEKILLSSLAVLQKRSPKGLKIAAVVLSPSFQCLTCQFPLQCDLALGLVGLEVHVANYLAGCASATLQAEKAPLLLKNGNDGWSESNALYPLSCEIIFAYR